jgi:O-antigen/teichoic acid export membrane protein
LLLVVQRKPAVSLASDSLFLVLVLGLAVSLDNHSSVEAFWWVITLSGLTSLAISILFARISIDLAGAGKWLTSEWPNGRYFFADFSLTNGISQGSIFFVAAFSGIAATGEYRSAQLLISPVNLILRSVAIILAPELVAQSSRGSFSTMRRWCVTFFLATVGVAILTVMILLYIPETWVSQLVGESASGALRIVPFSGVALAGFGFAMAAGLGLRAVGGIRSAFLSKLFIAPISVGLIALGTIWYGPIGAQLGVATGETLRGGINWRQLGGQIDTHRKKGVKG